MRHEETLKVAFTFHDLISTKHGSTSLSIRACYFPVFPLSSIPIALFTPCAVLCAVLFCYFPVSLLSSSCPPRVQCSSVTLLSSFSLLHVHLVCSAAPLSFLSLFSLLHVHLVCSAVPLLSCLSSLFFMSTSCAALFCCFPVSLLSSSCPPRVQRCSVAFLSLFSLLHVHLVYSAVLLLSCLPSLFFMSTSCIVLCAVLFRYSPVSLLSSSCPPRVQRCSCFFPVFHRSSFHITLPTPCAVLHRVASRCRR